MADSFGVNSKPNLNVADTNTLMQQGLSSNLSMLPQVMQAMSQYGPQYGAATLQANMASNPTLKNLASLVNQNLEQAQSGQMPATLSQYTQNAFRQGNASRGFGDSPMSSLTEAQTMGNAYNTFNNNAASQGVALGQLPGMMTSGAQLQQGLGLTMPTLQQQYDNQYQGQAYQNNVNNYLTNASNVRNQQISSMEGINNQQVAGMVGMGEGSMMGSLGSLGAPVGATGADTSDSAIASGPNAYANTTNKMNGNTANNYLMFGSK